MKFSDHKSQRAFTRVEALVVAAVLLALALVIPLLIASKRKSSRINCVNNLKQVGIACRIWEGDHNEEYPMTVPVALGGAQELLSKGNVAACFQVMSNQLADTKILVCTEDRQHEYATNFPSLNRTNISYFLGLNASDNDPQGILSGDDNLLQNGRTVQPGIVNLATNQTIWTTGRHQYGGNILLSDGSAQSFTHLGYSTNLIVIP